MDGKFLSRFTFLVGFGAILLAFLFNVCAEASHDPFKERQLSLCIAKVSIRTHIHGLRPKVGNDSEKKKELRNLEEHYQWLEKACPLEVEQRFGSAALSR
jgi:hypothetical protein